MRGVRSGVNKLISIRMNFILKILIYKFIYLHSYTIAGFFWHFFIDLFIGPAGWHRQLISIIFRRSNMEQAGYLYFV